MSKAFRIILYTLGSIVVLGLIAVGLLAVRTGQEQVIDGYSVNGLDLSGLNRDDALAALKDLEGRMASAPIGIEAGGARFDLLPSEVGFDLDENALLDAALAGSSPPSVVEAVRGWFAAAGPTIALTVSGTVDEQALSRVLDGYEQALGAAVEGKITLEGTLPIPQYPRSGQAIDRSTAGPRIAAALFERPRPETVTLDVIEKQPVLSVAAVDRAFDEILLLLDGPITLTRADPDVTLVLNEDQMARALVTRVERSPSPHLAVTLDPAVFDGYLERARTELVSAPESARLFIDDNEKVTVIPGFPGAVIDTDLAIQAAIQAARRPNRTTVLPLQEGVEPEITAEELVGLGGISKISEFTTMHPAGQPRVNNIQLFADHMDGRMLMPGETMSLNETVGMRTLEAGYAPAPTIIKGEIVDTVGGGVSQFATTFYNAVYWAGLEIIEHRPHSYYFSRYPEGIEATISWPMPDLVFRNDTESVVVIKTSYTRDSITVQLYGNNSDRLISSQVSGRFAPTEFPTVYFPNPEVMPWDGEVETQGGANGWSVKVTRTLTFTDGSTTGQDWTVRYRPWPRHVEVHPCLLPEDSEDYTGEECPEPPDEPAPDDTSDPAPDDTADDTPDPAPDDTDDPDTTTTAAPDPDSQE